MSGSDGDYKNLLGILASLDRPLLALSGGVDSAFLCHALKASGAKGAAAVTLKSDFFPDSEIERARMAAVLSGVRHHILDITGLHYELIDNNERERCYFCKRGIFAEIRDFAAKNGYNDILDGTNADDLASERPGMKALTELGIRSPLKEAGFVKARIRELSGQMELPLADSPSLSCLATRFPYGERPDRVKVKRILQAEEYLHSLGFDQVRVRSHGSLARIEVDPMQMKMFHDTETVVVIAGFLRSLGFDFVTLDLEGFRSGSMDATVSKGGGNEQRDTGRTL